jgi:acid phosphatase (class A)
MLTAMRKTKGPANAGPFAFFALPLATGEYLDRDPARAYGAAAHGQAGQVAAAALPQHAMENVVVVAVAEAGPHGAVVNVAALGAQLQPLDRPAQVEIACVAIRSVHHHAESACGPRPLTSIEPSVSQVAKAVVALIRNKAVKAAILLLCMINLFEYGGTPRRIGCLATSVTIASCLDPRIPFDCVITPRIDMTAPARFLLVIIFAGVVALAAVAQPSAGYLAAGMFDVMAVLPPAPVAGDPRYNADRLIFLETRKLVGAPRYVLATSDAQSGVADLMKDFSCAVGVSLTPQSAPMTAALIQRAARDTARETNRAKDIFKRLRPFQIDSGEICQDKVTLARSYDYPSGHTTAGWTWALILSELVPARSSEILARGRAYGESRFICGAHNESAVEAGRLSATVTMTAVRGTAAYQADAAAAKAEMATLLTDPATPKPDACAVEHDLIMQKVL